MTTQDTWPSLIPGDQMQPFQDIWNTLSRRSIFPVANDTERNDELIPWLATKGMEAPSADDPLYVHNASLPVGAQLQSTVDGSAWVTHDGRDTGWLPLSLGASWVGTSADYRAIGNAVYFRGSAALSAGSLPPSAVTALSNGNILPPQYQPTIRWNFQLAGNSAPFSVRAYIDSDGSFDIVTGSSAPSYVSLSGVSYLVG